MCQRAHRQPREAARRHDVGARDGDGGRSVTGGVEGVAAQGLGPGGLGVQGGGVDWSVELARFGADAGDFEGWIGGGVRMGVWEGREVDWRNERMVRWCCTVCAPPGARSGFEGLGWV